MPASAAAASRLAGIRAGLVATYSAKLVDKLLAAYIDAKRNFQLGKLRPTEVEGGRFCEAALRMLEERATGTYTALGKKLDTDKTIKQLANLPTGTQPDSVRLHIPRALRVVYDVRNNRDAAHLADDIDPNRQDATMVISVLDWVMAEVVRLSHNVPADEAQRIVDELVTRQVPAIQDFNGFLKVLRPQLQASDHILLLLYQRGLSGATYVELEEWSRPSMRSNLRQTLRRMTDERAHIHRDGTRYYLTDLGAREVEGRQLFRMA